MKFDNRKGHSYFFFEGKTKTGKPKYFASRSEESEKGVRLSSIPAGYEIWQSPKNAAVSIRKIMPTRITDDELEFAAAAAASLSNNELIHVERRGDQLTFYKPDRDIREIEFFFSALSDNTSGNNGADWSRMNMKYEAVIRLNLVEEKERIFSTERFCFKGSIDDWIPISYAGTIKELAPQIFPHLASESFFDLI